MQGPASGDYDELLEEVRSGQERLRAAEVRFKSLVETIPGVAYIAEPGEHGAWLYISPRLQQVLGYPPQDWIAEPTRWIGLIHPDDRERVIADEASWTETTLGVHVSEYRVLARDGSYRWIRDAATARPGEQPGDKALWFGVLSDVTESRDAQEALADSELLLRSVLETSHDAFVALDGAGTVLEWNRRAETMFGRPREEALGQQFTALVVPERLRATNPLALPGGSTAIAADIAGATVEMTALRDDGSEFVTELTLWPTTSGAAVRYNALIRDIAERKELQEELHALAFSDALTGLANRTLFGQRLDLALARHGPAAGSLVVLFLDIDDFKVVNDSLGHSAGDQLLAIVADRLRVCIRPGDTVARFAGDEFAILLPDVHNLADSTAVADRIGHALQEPCVLEGRRTVISASIGIATSTTTRTITADELLREADAAMYQAKRSGKRTWVIFDHSRHATSLERLQLQADLAQAVERQELFVHYQPYFDLTDGSLAGFEALMRWNHPVRGLISPADFIPLAEDSGVIHPIGDWLLRVACRDAQSWRGSRPADRAPSININVSALQIQDPSIVGKIAAAVRLTGLDPRALVLEITEGVLMQRVDQTVSVLRELQLMGVRIAIDDFGTGYSSLSYLQNLPVDVLKIDKSFVDNVGAAPGAASMARIVVQIGHSLGFQVVAEGVETAEQATSLRAFGCDQAQGFHLGMPMSSAAAADLANAAPPCEPSHPATLSKQA